MIKFIHTYTKETIKIFLESGLFRKGHGLKIMHKPAYTPPYDFNSIAKKDGLLHSVLNELGCPFYIDRFQGGIGYPKTYHYDKELLGYYRNSENIDFMGFQLHEWASNFRSDQKRITELAEKEGISTAEILNNKEWWQKIIDGKVSLFLEAYSPEEWSEIAIPANRQEFITACEELYKRRLKETDGLIFPTDSYFMAFRTELENGAKMLLPEVGWQIPNMRFQLAFARGMAKSAGIPWGIYYECWYCNPQSKFSIPFSLRDAQDEWVENLLTEGFGNELPFEKREYGGSSLSLMERAWVYAYFSGAEIIGEEYGVCNTFRSCNSTELSPYGEVKKKFIDLTENYTPKGSLYTPFAVILPTEMTMPDPRLTEDYLEYPPDEFFTKEYMRGFIDTAHKIFGVNGSYGNMGHTLRNGGLADIYDVIYEDMEDILKNYSYIIDLTGKHSNDNNKNTLTPEKAAVIQQELLPVSINKSLHYTFRKDNEDWEILIMNNDGIQHESFMPDVIIEEAAVTAALTERKENFTIEKLSGTGSLTSDEKGFYVSLNGGEWIIIAVTAKN